MREMSWFGRRRGVEEESLDTEDQGTLGWMRGQGAIGQAYATRVVEALEAWSALNGAPRTIPGRSAFYNQVPAAPDALQNALQRVTEDRVRARPIALELFSEARAARRLPGDRWSESADLMERLALSLVPELNPIAKKLDPRFEDIRRKQPGLDAGAPVEPSGPGENEIQV
jgi:hypothetical protein